MPAQQPSCIDHAPGHDAKPDATKMVIDKVSDCFCRRYDMHRTGMESKHTKQVGDASKILRGIQLMIGGQYLVLLLNRGRRFYVNIFHRQYFSVLRDSDSSHVQCYPQGGCETGLM